MSFASEVKKEILSNIDEKKCCKEAFLLGVLQGCAAIVIDTKGVKIQIKSPILNLIKKIVPLLKEQFKVDTDIGYRDELMIKNKRRYYYIDINDDKLLISEYFRLLITNEMDMEFPLIHNQCCETAFIKGMFCARGSINDPRKECYHLEISCRRYDVAFVIQQILGKKNIEANIIPRRDTYVVYIKKSEYISNFLALVQASSGVFYFEDSRIFRDYANMANRIANCDIANEKKCLEKCEKQLQAIELIKQKGMFNKMPVRLQSIAKMREEYPESSFDELSFYSDNIFGKKLSKSGISHCMRDLMEYAEIINKSNEKPV